jgi:hypothetical protein
MGRHPLTLPEARVEALSAPPGKQAQIMSSISIVGAGNMARILGTRALAGGNTVEVIGRDKAKAAALPVQLQWHGIGHP